MNKNDCDRIAFILADGGAHPEFCDRFFKLDERIREDYLGYQAALGRDEDVNERMNEILKERFGNDWCMQKRVTREDTKGALEQARREIYGEDYDPSLFK